MKKHCISALLAFLCCHLQAQSNSEIGSWQQAHPDVIFIEASDLERMKASGIEMKGNLIVYTDEISITDITSYEEEVKMLHGDSEPSIYSERSENAAIIKVWLAENGDVKILQQSYFDQLNETQRTMYLENDALVLLGELLTLKDITDYESAH